ncbi:hypothetical protein D5396_18965 [Rahnella inusitata]|uniref:Uncharacterized protein n=1 Tax=Rahnella inusitata TaxID=58169 RepID=A0ABX9NVY3_9GAMM|nr:hypothetical protein D5396_18965 [Rahnella inusitata]
MSQYLLGVSKAQFLIDNSARMLRREEKDCQPRTNLFPQHLCIKYRRYWQPLTAYVRTLFWLHSET